MNAKPLRIGMIVGEASGDVLAEGLLLALQSYYPSLMIEGVLGPRVLALGGQSLYPMESLSMMGFVEPVRQLPSLLKMRRHIINYFLENPPDLFIGVDSPDFTLNVEKRLKKVGVPTVHYVSPSVWAWRKGRIKMIRHAVDLMLVLFPFEADFYRDERVRAVFVGHPLADTIPLAVDQTSARKALNLDTSRPTLAVLPGSRLGEIQHLAPLYLAVVDELRKTIPTLQVVVPLVSPGIRQAFTDLVKETELVLVDGQAQQVMQASDAVLLTSGTATLEAMLCHRPMVVAFKSSWLNSCLIRKFVDIPFFSLPNLLFNRRIVPEYFQEEATVPKLTEALLGFLENVAERELIQAEFLAMHQKLRVQASQRAAETVANMLSK